MPILLVPLRQQVDCALGLSSVIHNAGRAVGAHPPQLAPVVLVMVRENGDRGIGRDVLQALKVRRPFCFCVDREVKGVSVYRENKRHDVRSSVIADRSKASNLRLSESPLRLAGFHVMKCGRI